VSECPSLGLAPPQQNDVLGKNRVYTASWERDPPEVLSASGNISYMIVQLIVCSMVRKEIAVDHLNRSYLSIKCSTVNYCSVICSSLLTQFVLLKLQTMETCVTKMYSLRSLSV
jgi:hypothetical protein